MIRKNALRLALLLSLCVLLAACSNDDEKESSETDEPKENSEVTKEEEASDATASEETDSEQTSDTEEPVSEEEESQVVHMTVEESLEDVMTELISIFEEEHENVEIDAQYGHTESLTEDLINGDDQDMDIYFSSSDQGYESLVEAGILDQLATKYLLINEIVLVTTEDNEDITSYDSIFKNDDATLSIVNPESSLSGSHAEELIQAEKSNERTIENIEKSNDIDTAVSDIKEGKTDAGLLLRTEVSEEEDLKIVSRAPRSLTDPFVYSLGLSQDIADDSVAKEFYRFLQSEEALEVFANYGYIV